MTGYLVPGIGWVEDGDSGNSILDPGGAFQESEGGGPVEPPATGNKLYLGATEITTLKLGDTDISTVYLGSLINETTFQGSNVTFKGEGVTYG